MPQHRSYQIQIEEVSQTAVSSVYHALSRLSLLIVQIINARGAYVLWNPPNSPDYNPIEKLWDISLSAISRRIHDLISGNLGRVRAFGQGDLAVCLRNSRMSLHAFYCLLGATE